MFTGPTYLLIVAVDPVTVISQSANTISGSAVPVAVAFSFPVSLVLEESVCAFSSACFSVVSLVSEDELDSVSLVSIVSASFCSVSSFSEEAVRFSEVVWEDAPSGDISWSSSRPFS
ncbi:hypothetical protein [Enterococcus hirae]|uniref:hypothetical protein n=1 Tax=Enterococcus hirae TaxID=1354 RepID=UPI002DBE7BB5|nr:hypothetical protein [Enterococcus hirae]MEB5879846.1 hypothetical protein [Enterococcus hirae]MEB5906647.1 hypothetical protein [Enterococcus hirae]